MTIKIRQIGEKYRIVLDDEEWQFENRKELEQCLKYFLDMKEKKGRINNNKL